MKKRNSINYIKYLHDSNSCLLQTEHEIQTKIMGFYKTLLGSNNPSMPAIDLNVIKEGPLLTKV